jgi:hypothetical protein
LVQQLRLGRLRAVGHRDDMQRHTSLLKFLTQQELMRQLAGQPVQIMHNDSLHQALLHEVTEVCKLRAGERCASIVIDKDMGVWHGRAFLVRHGPTCLNLCRQGIALVGLLSRRHARIDGRWQQAMGLWGRSLPWGCAVR